jgi:hypothetical protein
MRWRWSRPSPAEQPGIDGPELSSVTSGLVTSRSVTRLMELVPWLAVVGGPAGVNPLRRGDACVNALWRPRRIRTLRQSLPIGPASGQTLARSHSWVPALDRPRDASGREVRAATGFLRASIPAGRTHSAPAIGALHSVAQQAAVLPVRPAVVEKAATPMRSAGDARTMQSKPGVGPPWKGFAPRSV